MKAIERVISPVKRRLNNIVSRAVVGLVDDNKKMQEIQVAVLAAEIQDEVERMQDYGFSSVPLPGAEALMVYVGGIRDHGVAVKVDDRNFRPTGGTPGSSCIYDSLGNKFALENDGVGKVVAPLVELGSGSTKEKILNGESFQTLYNAHTHTVFGVVSSPPLIPSTPLELSQAVTAATLPV